MKPQPCNLDCIRCFLGTAREHDGLTLKEIAQRAAASTPKERKSILWRESKRLARILGRLVYKPGYAFSAGGPSEYPHNFGMSVLHVTTAKIPDVTYLGKKRRRMIVVGAETTVDLGESDKNVVRKMRDMVRGLERHEADEWLHLDGVPVTKLRHY